MDFVAAIGCAEAVCIAQLLICSRNDLRWPLTSDLFWILKSVTFSVKQRGNESADPFMILVNIRNVCLKLYTSIYYVTLELSKLPIVRLALNGFTI